MEWNWYAPGAEGLLWHWSPNNGFAMNHAIRGWNETLITYVLAAGSPRYGIDAKTRQRWLQAIHPTARLRIIPDINDDDNSEAWAEHTVRFLGQAPDVVFSSEEYGIRYAALMGARHRMVDKPRTKRLGMTG